MNIDVWCVCAFASARAHVRMCMCVRMRARSYTPAPVEALLFKMKEFLMVPGLLILTYNPPPIVAVLLTNVVVPISIE